jgi:hypothetical protein
LEIKIKKRARCACVGPNQALAHLPLHRSAQYQRSLAGAADGWATCASLSRALGNADWWVRASSSIPFPAFSGVNVDWWVRASSSIPFPAFSGVTEPRMSRCRELLGHPRGITGFRCNYRELTSAGVYRYVLQTPPSPSLLPGPIITVEWLHRAEEGRQ